MNLHDLTEALQRDLAAHGDRIVGQGFADPDSYRGFYEEVAFAPARNVTVRSMLEHARSADGATFHGWKGGDYVMTGSTVVNLAHRGETGDEIDDLALRLMLDSAPVSDPTAAAGSARAVTDSVEVTLHLSGTTATTNVTRAEVAVLLDLVKQAWAGESSTHTVSICNADGTDSILVRLAAVEAVHVDDSNPWNAP